MEKYESASCAANWWAEKISNPIKFDNGDRSHLGDMASMSALMLASSHRSSLSNEQVENFKQLLDETIEKQLDTRGHCYLMVDYEPEEILYEIAMKTGVDSSLFPWQTTMEITENEVRVSEAYGQPYQDIYPVKQKKK